MARFKADAPEFEVAMPTSRLFSLFAGVCPALLVLALLPVEATGASPWSLGISAGAADRYTYHDHDKYGWGTHFDYSWTASLGASRSLSRHLSMQVDAGYLSYDRGLSILSIPEIPPPSSELSAQFPSLGVGLRYYPTGPATARARAYLQFVPTLYVSRWKERSEYPAYTDFFSGTYYPARLEEDTFTSVLPGFAAGIGVVGLNQTPIRLDLGFRYYYSASPGSQGLGRFSSGDFDGLRQLALVVGLHKPL